MYNHDLLNKMIDQFGVEKVTEFAKMVSFMHDVLYKEHLESGKDDVTEHNFERDWWKLKYEELLKFVKP
jgi:hypothetical protein